VKLATDLERTFAIPIHDYLKDRHSSFSTNGKYSGSGMHARRRSHNQVQQKKSGELSNIANPPCSITLFARCRDLVCLTIDAFGLHYYGSNGSRKVKHTKIHNVIPADGTVINHNVLKIIFSADSEYLSKISPHAQRATAFHY